MSTITRGTTPLVMAIGRSWSWPATWQSPSAAIVDITGYTVAARLAWAGGGLALGASVTNAPQGQFALSIAAGATNGMPIGRLSELVITLTEPDGVTTHDMIYPIDAVMVPQ